MSRACVFLDMQDVPHLGEKEMKQILAGVPSWQLQARKSGIPGHGVGAAGDLAVVLTRRVGVRHVQPGG